MKNKNRWIGMIVFSVIFITFIILFWLEIPVPCLFQQVFGISCPSCGMTRAFHAFLRGDGMAMIQYNVLSLPLLLVLMGVVGCSIYDVITNQNTLETKIIRWLGKYYLWIIAVIIIGWCVNGWI